MNKFDERKKNFEKKFQIDQELKFKVEARRNKYLENGPSKDKAKQKNRKKIRKMLMV